MAEEKWNTKKLAGIGALLCGAAMLIASGANGRLFTAAPIITINAVFLSTLIGAGVFAAVSGLRNHFKAPDTTTQKWNTGRIALIGAAIGVTITVLSAWQTGLAHDTDPATSAGMLSGQIAGGIVWGACIAAAFSAARNFMARRRIPAAPEKTS